MKLKRVFGLVMILTMIFSSLPIVTAEDVVIDATADVQVTTSFSRNNAVIDNENGDNNMVDITYRIQPQAILAEKIPDITPPKEVVLVIDVSGSMDWQSRLSTVKTAAKNFVDEISKNSNISIGLVKYSYSANKVQFFTDNNYIPNSYMLDVSDGSRNKTRNINEFKDAINDLRANGGTNVGDGIRLGYSILNNNSYSDPDADKFLIFLTDGDTNNRTVITSGSRTVEYSGDLEVGETENGVSPRTDGGDALLYAQNMANLCSNFKKNYFVGVSTSSTKLEQIADDDFKPNYQYIPVKDASGIAEVYDDISYRLAADADVANIMFQEVLPQGIKYIDTVSIGGDTNKSLKQSETNLQELTGNIGDIAYRLNDAKTHFIADPIDIVIRVEVEKPDDFKFNDTQIEVTYIDVNRVTTNATVNESTLTFTRDPITGVVASRPTHSSGNPDNKVVLSWDNYPGGVSYNVYKVVGGTPVFIKSVPDTSQDTMITEIPIVAGDTSKTEYRVEGVLADGEVSGRGIDDVNTNPSILNASVTRVNNTFKVTWDAIPGVANYTIRPYIAGSGLVEDSNQDHFVEIDGKIEYRYELLNPMSYKYGDKVKFLVGATKPNASVNSAYTNELELKQIVSTTISTNLQSFNYAKAKDVEIAIDIQDTFPTGVELYDPMLVVDITLPENANTPLSVTYPTVRLDQAFINRDADNKITSYNVVSPEAITVTRAEEDKLRLYIRYDDFKNEGIPHGEDYRLKLNFAITYESDENGKLKTDIFTKLRGNSDLEIYQIENTIRSLLDKFYTQNIDEMISIKTSFMYNTSLEITPDPILREVTVGVASQYIKLQDVTNISDEF